MIQFPSLILILTVFFVRCGAGSDNKGGCKNQFPDLFSATIEDLQSGLSCGNFTSTDLVKAYLARIDEVNLKGPALRAVIETNPTALEAAKEVDTLRGQGRLQGPLHGIPIILKDNIATRVEDGMNTTAGSFALLDSVVPGDATITKKLRNAGAIIIGKASLSEWSAHRSSRNPNGWSARGGQATSAFYPRGDACGSSTGSGIATSIGLAERAGSFEALRTLVGTLETLSGQSHRQGSSQICCQYAAIGTDTGGSITCPSSHNNLVGIRPSVGLTSRYLVIPISQNQDTVGPMTKTVADAAAILNVIAGPDLQDNFTLAQPSPVPDYTQHLLKDALNGTRIGLYYSGSPDYVVQVLGQVVKTVFKPLGAKIVNINLDDASEILSSTNQSIVLAYDFKYGINKYLSGLKHIPTNATTLKGLIKFNIDHPRLEFPPGRDGQDYFLAAEKTTNLSDPKYLAALKADHELGGRRGIDATLKKYNLDAIVAPSESWITYTPSAIAGYPVVTVPLGFFPKNTAVTSRPDGLPLYPTPNMPFGVSFIGKKWSEARLIELAYSYEQATQTRSKGKPFAVPKTQLRDIVHG